MHELDTLTFSFDSPHQLCQLYAKEYTNESPPRYYGILDTTCTFTLSQSIDDSSQNKAFSISFERNPQSPHVSIAKSRGSESKSKNIVVWFGVPSESLLKAKMRLNKCNCAFHVISNPNLLFHSSRPRKLQHQVNLFFLVSSFLQHPTLLG